MFDLDDLRVFVKVADLGGLSKAAEALGRPKSTASRQIARLEAQAGSPLLDRSSGAMRLTDTGRLLRQHAQNVLDTLDVAAAAMGAAQQRPSGTLRINAPHLFAANIIAPRVAEFLDRHADVDLVIDTAQKPVGETAPDVDISIRVGPLEDSARIGKKIGVSELRLFASPAALGPLAPDVFERRLEASGLIETARLTQFRQLIVRNGEAMRVAANIWEPATRHAFVLAGVGASWLPAFLCQPDVQAGRLVQLLPGRRFGPIDIFALYSAQGGTTAKVRAFIDFLVQLDFAPPAEVALPAA